MAQLGQSARLGAVRSQVRILLPRFIINFLLIIYRKEAGTFAPAQHEYAVLHFQCNYYENFLLVFLFVFFNLPLGIFPHFIPKPLDIFRKLTFFIPIRHLKIILQRNPCRDIRLIMLDQRLQLIQ